MPQHEHGRCAYQQRFEQDKEYANELKGMLSQLTPPLCPTQTAEPNSGPNVRGQMNPNEIVANVSETGGDKQPQRTIATASIDKDKAAQPLTNRKIQKSEPIKAPPSASALTEVYEQLIQMTKEETKVYETLAGLTRGGVTTQSSKSSGHENVDQSQTVEETTTSNDKKIYNHERSKAQLIEMVQRTLTPEDIAALNFQTQRTAGRPPQKVEANKPSEECTR